MYWVQPMSRTLSRFIIRIKNHNKQHYILIRTGIGVFLFPRPTERCSKLGTQSARHVGSARQCFGGFSSAESWTTASGPSVIFALIEQTKWNPVYQFEKYLLAQKIVANICHTSSCTHYGNFATFFGTRYLHLDGLQLYKSLSTFWFCGEEV